MSERNDHTVITWGEYKVLLAEFTELKQRFEELDAQLNPPLEPAPEPQPCAVGGCAGFCAHHTHDLCYECWREIRDKRNVKRSQRKSQLELVQEMNGVSLYD